MAAARGTRDTVREEVVDGVALLTLNRPERKNAFNVQMWDELRDALRDAQASEDVRVVVLTGSEGAFTAGQDLAEMMDYPELDDAPHGYEPFMEALIAFDKPLVAAVNGVGVGIGLTVLMHCDLVYIAEGARLRAPFVALGLVPEGASSYLLATTIGYQQAAEVFFTAGWIGAGRALELGIATRLCSPTGLLDAAMEKAREIAHHPRVSLQKTKRLMMRTRDAQVRAALAAENVEFAECVGSPENLEALQRFFGPEG